MALWRQFVKRLMFSSTWTLLVVGCAVILPAVVTADITTFTRTDIVGNDIDCGQGAAKCRVCGDINSVEASCVANPSCTAFTFDNSCGLLKSAAEPRTYREGYSAFVIIGKSPAGSPAGISTGSSPSPSSAATARPSQISPTPQGAPPATDTVQVSAPATAPTGQPPNQQPAVSSPAQPAPTAEPAPAPPPSTQEPSMQPVAADPPPQVRGDRQAQSAQMGPSSGGFGWGGGQGGVMPFFGGVFPGRRLLLHRQKEGYIDNISLS